RQRYWGEPIPVVHYDGKIEPVPEEDLPITLPEVKDYQPTGTGEPPLAKALDWVNTPDGGHRETNTMPQWAGSCWYYLRYLDPKNNERPWDPEKEKYWMPVDIYIGGQEHAVLHLLYARFWHHVLHDLGLVSTREPFKKLFNQGMILGEDGVKMSKSRGNVVNPDTVIQEYGADAVRMYEMFMGPLDKTKPWSTKGLQGCARFLQRVWDFYQNVQPDNSDPDPDTRRLYHQTVKKVTDDIETLDFNTAISQMMIFINQVSRCKSLPRTMLEGFLKLINPFAPHLAEELNRIVLKNQEELAYQPWPTYDSQWIQAATVTVAIQVNGKVRGKIQADAQTPKTELRALAVAEPNVKKYLDRGEIIKEVYVPGKLFSFVVRE
ncbi:MAG: leucine--tRNA ligase, partial [Candidatus Neomarinimicrobiota bacterium]